MDSIILRRLAFIKYLVEVGVNQSHLPEPISASSILTFHDATELFLHLASEHHNVGNPQTNFMEYWELLSPVVKETLPQKESMRRLNKARVSFKHHGTLPSNLDIDAFRSTTSSFFEDATPLVFGISFEEISLSDFVYPENARQHLKIAEAKLSEGNIVESFDNSAIAFKILVDDYERTKRGKYSKSPFFFGEDLSYLDSSSIGLRFGGSKIAATAEFQRNLADFIDKVGNSLESIQHAIKILAMGINYPRYSRFKLLTPRVVKPYEGGFEIHRRHDAPELTGVADDAQFCMDFVIESALKLQEFDYSTIGKYENDA